MFEFRPFSHDDVEATAQKWEREAFDNDCFPEDVPKKLHPVRAALTCVSVGPHKTLHYGVFQKGSQVAVALAEMVLTDRGALGGKWLKLLKLTMSPEVETLLIEEHQDATETTVKAYATAVIGAFKERMTHEADTLKIYGRSEDQLKFLSLLLMFINQEQGHKLTGKKEGRWLVLRTSTQRSAA